MGGLGLGPTDNKVSWVRVNGGGGDIILDDGLLSAGGGGGILDIKWGGGFGAQRGDSVTE